MEEFVNGLGITVLGFALIAIIVLVLFLYFQSESKKMKIVKAIRKFKERNLPSSI